MYIKIIDLLFLPNKNNDNDDAFWNAFLELEDLGVSFY